MTQFDGIYDQPDPRAYFRVLGPLEYQTPHHAQGIFRRVLAACEPEAQPAEPATMLDICCSYGINAALLNHRVTLDDLYAHYTSPQATALTTAELIEWDRAYYAARRRPDAVRVIGLDAATNAISYARAVGLLEEGFDENLETATTFPSWKSCTATARSAASAKPSCPNSPPPSSRPHEAPPRGHASPDVMGRRQEERRPRSAPPYYRGSAEHAAPVR
ncbi:hypothetical protein ACH4PU_34665 [Streptomyces sp. NPDC021100]|uniref:hypothetical protein n=1 Tax=Streptomyces sp. NPDC021100 TaxID=3365114 RepID=UPI0037B2962E